MIIENLADRRLRKVTTSGTGTGPETILDIDYHR